ncbi:MAG: hypothetical protein WD960_05705 [Gemmatimonadota bacterium]
MIHAVELRRWRAAVKSPRSPRVSMPLAGALALVLLLAGCGRDEILVGSLYFGQVGELQVDVRSAVGGGIGRLDETLLWRSEGPWVLVERLSYSGRHGDETIRRPTLNPGELTGEYASLVRQLNETPGLRLIGSGVSQDLDPDCGPRGARVTVTLRDTAREESARWIRCAEGTLFSVGPGTAGPDGSAARVITAAQLTRFFTIGEEAGSSYLGTVPFATLARGEDSPAAPQGPRAYRSEDGEAPEEWLEFWAAHAGGETPPPHVDWSEEMVLLGAAGRSLEAGEGIKIRRILPIEGGSRVELIHRVPGNFCSPAATEAYPFHLVVAPRGDTNVLFNQPLVERVPCG